MLSRYGAGAMTRISFDQMRPTPNGDMYMYNVEVDEDNTIDVSALADDQRPCSRKESEENELSELLRRRI